MSEASGIEKSSLSFVAGLAPAEEEIQETIGPYQILRSVGKGGMGEVLLAYDTSCGRRIALKKIRADLIDNSQLQERFLKEALITCQLTHPSIIPIYTISDEKGKTYYTMPHVEGETLKQLLRRTRQAGKEGTEPPPIGGSIPSLIRVFLSVCQAIAYAHSKGVLHRDLKPENIIIGRYGEVLILDWGLATLMQPKEAEKPMEDQKTPINQTVMGKVVGTISYMAHERARGEPATPQSDIYALGVILYQLLTLHLPFHRGSLKEFRANMDKEVLKDPIEKAPYRDVPRLLAQITLRCLEKNRKERYPTVDSLIHDIENYIEGRSEWFEIATLDPKERKDWEFQENVLIAEQMAITRNVEVTEWINLMVSKNSFSGNTRLEARIRIGPTGNGIGFLLSVPEKAERRHPNDGYCLWLSATKERSTKLLRSTIEVIHDPNILLEKEHWYDVAIEKRDNKIYLYIDGTVRLIYLGHLPLVGTHVGLTLRDDDCTIEAFSVLVGSHSVTVNCLAVPDAFLAHKNYTTALAEYRRIGYSFPGRAEGREALFRAGITLLDQGRRATDPKKREKRLDQSLIEFEKLHDTPGAPLEYLGKALVYKAAAEYEEEVKCFELAYRRYRNHPLLPILKEEIVYRMHEASRLHRKLTYRFILLVLSHLPDVASTEATRLLFENLQKNWEPLPFILTAKEQLGSKEDQHNLFEIQLAFWLAKPYVLSEKIETLYKKNPQSLSLLGDALFCLIELGAYSIAAHTIDQLSLDGRMRPTLKPLKWALLCHKRPLQEVMRSFSLEERSDLSLKEARFACHLMECALISGQTAIIHELSAKICQLPTSPIWALKCCSYQISAFLLENRWEEAGNLFSNYSFSQLTDEKNPLYPIYGCWLAATEGREIAQIHFASLLETPYPRSSALLAHHIYDEERAKTWLPKAFLWEKRQLYQQLALFAHCCGNLEDANHHLILARREALDSDLYHGAG